MRRQERLIRAVTVLLMVISVLFFALVFPDTGRILRQQVQSILGTLGERAFTSASELQWPTLGNGFSANYTPMQGDGQQVDESAIQSPVNVGSEYTFDPTTYIYRTLLPEDSQRVYNQVYANALTGNRSRFTLIAPITEAALSDVMCAVYNDHPEMFWLDTSYSYGFLPSGKVVTVVLSYNAAAEDITAYQWAFGNAAEKILSPASLLSSDMEKEKYVHDALMERVSYDTEAAMHQSAYSALVSGSSVCAGYARAFQYLLMRLNIPCYYCTGRAAGGDHAWNIVRLDGAYYNVDLAWDDSAGAAGDSYAYSYFNVPDSTFSADHTRTALSLSLPACEGTSMTYQAVYGKGNPGNMPASPGATYQSLGYGDGDVISSLSAYNRYCRDYLLSHGTGEHTFRLVLKNEDLLKDVYAAAKNNGFVSDYAQEVVDALRLTECNVSLSLRGENLAGGYVLLTQTITLTGTAAATKAPTRAPTATPEPTAAPTEPPTPEPTQAPAVVTPEPVWSAVPGEMGGDGPVPGSDPFVPAPGPEGNGMDPGQPF